MKKIIQLFLMIVITMPFLGLRFSQQEDGVLVYGPRHLVRKFALQYQNGLWPGWQVQADMDQRMRIELEIHETISGSKFSIQDRIHQHAFRGAMKKVQHQP